MGVARRIVFPIVRLVLWAVIAAALVAIALQGADLSQAEDGLQPTGQLTEPTLEVSTATVTNTVVVPGAVVADPAVPVLATAAGTVSKILAGDGPVAAGAPLLEIRQETPVEPTVRTDKETGEQTVTENKPKVTRTTVTAPVAGTLDLTALKDQVVAVGDTVGAVSPGTLSVTGTLTADQQYRLVGAPGEATVTLQGGPAPFVCTGLRIGAAPSAGPAPADGSSGGGEATSTGAVTCAIPGDVTAFAGLGAQVEITNGEATDAVVVPVTAVLGSAQKGSVWVVVDGGEPEEREVAIGLTDGENVQITEGLAAGEQVLQFTPLPDATEAGPDCTDPMQYDPSVCA